MFYKFELTQEQEVRYRVWKNSLPIISEGHFGAAGGGYWFKFIPTGLGMIVTAGRDDVPELNVDLTEWENF